MAKNASPKKRLFIAKNLIMMLVLAVTITLAVFSWFTQHSSATANGINIRTKAVGIEIAKCIKGYNSDGDVIRDGPGEFVSRLTLEDIPPLSKDCTGDGDWYRETGENDSTVDIKTLIVPEFNVSNQSENVKQKGKEVNLNVQAAKALSNLDAEDYHRKNENKDIPEYQYIAVEFYVRSHSQELTLSSDSKLMARTEADGSSLQYPTYSLVVDEGPPVVTKPVDKTSAYGGFNVDGLVGAMRVSLIAQPADEVTQTWSEDANPKTHMYSVTSANSTLGAPVKQMLWLPRPDVYLNIGSTLNDWTLDTGVTSDRHNGDSYKHTYYKRNSGDTGVTYVDNDTSAVVSTISGSNVVLGQNINISRNLVHPVQNSEKSTLVVNSSNKTVSDNYYVTKYTMFIWIEGTDAEARRAMDGGQFDLELNFQ